MRSGFNPSAGFRAYGGFRGAVPGPQPGRFPGAYSYRTPFTTSRYAQRQGYGGLWRRQPPADAARYQPRPYPQRTYAGPYRRGYAYGGYATSYPLIEPPFDSCFLGCLDLFSDGSPAGADTSSWSGAGNPDPWASGTTDPTVPFYSAQTAPYAAGYSAPGPGYYAAPYPAQPAYGGGGRPKPADEEEAVTLVFKDGRPPLQVRNYILTRSAIYLAGKHFNEILVSDLDLPATQRVNWDAGVTFRLP